MAVAVRMLPSLLTAYTYCMSFCRGKVNESLAPSFFFSNVLLSLDTYQSNMSLEIVPSFNSTVSTSLVPRLTFTEVVIKDGFWLVLE